MQVLRLLPGECFSLQAGLTSHSVTQSKKKKKDFFISCLHIVRFFCWQLVREHHHKPTKTPVRAVLRITRQANPATDFTWTYHTTTTPQSQVLQAT